MTFPVPIKKVMVLLENGFEEIEAVTVIDFLRRAPCRVTVASMDGRAVTGSRRIQLLPDAKFEDVLTAEFDALFLPGGILAVQRLCQHTTLLELIRSMNERGKWIAAICAAPLILKAAGILEGRKLTSYPNLRDQFPDDCYVEEDVVVDRNWVTSRSPGTAMAFAIELIRRLGYEGKADEIAELALFRSTMSRFHS